MIVDHNPIQDLFFSFLVRRESARNLKLAGIFPHTKDPILAAYSFCNINREHDAVTRFIKEHIRDNPTINSWGPNAMALNITIGRIFNNPGTLSEIGPVSGADDIRTRVLPIIVKRQARKQTIFRGAYMMPSHGSPAQLKTPPAEYYLNAAVELSRLNFRKAETLAQAAELVQSVHGFGPFLTNQIVTDLRYTRWWELAPDWQEFVLGGPGTSRGLCRFFDVPLSINRAQKWIHERLVAVREMAPGMLSRFTGPTAVELFRGYFLDPNNLSNSFCEFDKYVRVRDGGTLKRYYRPVQ